MAGSFPMDWGEINNGECMDLLCKVKLFDLSHDNHIMETLYSKKCFKLTGLISTGFESFTIFDATLITQYPVPHLSLSPSSVVLGHKEVTWDSLHSVYDMCCGFGGISQGLLACGFHSTVGVDHNAAMVKLFSKCADAHVIEGDVGSKSIIQTIWKQGGDSATMTGGFSCQPFSCLGDERGAHDPRSSCLSKLLYSAFYLRVQLLILECVAPASQNQFVKSEIEHFCVETGFHCSQKNLALDQVWPSKRNRAWWILSSPMIGHIRIPDFQSMSPVSTVEMVIPQIQPWDLDDERALELTPEESLVFGQQSSDFSQFLLNAKGKSPCALHAWGNQITACPCGCRPTGLSSRRLEDKGLYGLLLKSAPDLEGNVRLRHAHPSEVMALNGMDPVLDFASNPRLVLSAVGQIASPLHVVWIMSSISAHFDAMQGNSVKFTPEHQLQAYASWLLMRCRLVWPCDEQLGLTEKLTTLVRMWQDFDHWFLSELVYPLRWPDSLGPFVSVAAILDHLLSVPHVPQVVPAAVPSTAIDDDVEMDEPETPWFESPPESGMIDAPLIDAAFCTVIFNGDQQVPVQLKPDGIVTFGDFVIAHSKLVGQFHVVHSVDVQQNPILPTDVLRPGQIVSVEVVVETEQHPVIRHSVPAVPDAPTVSPTAEWTQPVCPVPLHPSVYDIGECVTPTSIVSDSVVHADWLNADPLLGLVGDQFLQLSPPQVRTPQQLWSVRHQFVTKNDRVKILDNQGDIFSDDELRFHLGVIGSKYVDLQLQFSKDPIKKVVVIDPLISTAWLHDKGFSCELWGQDHGFVHANAIPVITVVGYDKHWIPISMHPCGDALNVFVWDNDLADHAKLNQMIESLGLSMGFLSVLIQRDRRMFLTSDRCGALAVSYLYHTILGVQLPHSDADVMFRAQTFREQFRKSLSTCDIAKRPWIWAKGDRSTSSTELPGFPLPDFPPSLISTDERIQLLVDHGFAVGDDEIRFHLQHILRRYEESQQRRGREPSQFHWFEPLVFTCWESIGRTISKQWCDRHPDILANGSQVITAFNLDNHWFPFWWSPNGSCLSFHTLANSHVDAHRFRDVCACIALQLGFPQFALHVIPNGLPDHSLCGAHSMIFLAHVVHRAPLPTTLDGLKTLHANMRAAFVEDVITRGMVPTPVQWGNGSRSHNVDASLVTSVPLHTLPLDLEPPASQALIVDHFDWNRVRLLIDWKFEICPPFLESKQQYAGSFGHRNMLAMDLFEMAFHVSNLQPVGVGRSSRMPLIQVVPSVPELVTFGELFELGSYDFMCHICLVEGHWIPIVALKHDLQVRAFVPTEVSECIRKAFAHMSWTIHGVSGLDPNHHLCGAFAIGVLEHVLHGFCHVDSLEELEAYHFQLRTDFLVFGFHVPASEVIGFGPGGNLVKMLADELTQHGVPQDLVEARAKEAIRAIGSEQLLTAMKHKHPWRQLKTLGNNHKFKFVLPSELESSIGANKTANVGGKGKGKSNSKASTIDLDPNKLQILDGSFRAQGHPVPQLHAKQIGPVSSGVVLMTVSDAEPYLRAAKAVSNEPLAMLVLHRPDVKVETSLPHFETTVPCRCTIDQEPVLADATLVQIGTGLIEKYKSTQLVELDTLDVVTIKFMVYRDELSCSWETFCKAPIRFLVQEFPSLKRCFTSGCKCEHWHNEAQLPLKEPILDVWRRQFLRSGFKQSPMDKAEMFSVCLRLPVSLMEGLLASSGTSGVYCEPRSADGTEVLSAFTVVWTPKLNTQELMHLQQTNPAIIGLARVGERKGLRVKTDQAQIIHNLVRPDTVYLPQGHRSLYIVGPFPFGVDRGSICKAMKQAGWECRPLQPTAPSPGRGSMWLVQAVEDPSMTIVLTTHGEVVITKHKPEPAGRSMVAKPVAAASTLALCDASASKTVQEDPWSSRDPWGGFRPTVSPGASHATESLQQMEVRVQNAVLAKLPAPMEQDDLPDRMNALEGQMQQLMAKHHGLETQMHEHSVQHGQQLSSMQAQLNAQGQQLHGHMETQSQAMQSMFAQQMEQIRGLLSKRPRDDHE